MTTTIRPKGWRNTPRANANREAILAALPGSATDIANRMGVPRELVYRHLMSLDARRLVHIAEVVKNPRGGKSIQQWALGPRAPGVESRKEIAARNRARREAEGCTILRPTKMSVRNLSSVMAGAWR